MENDKVSFTDVVSSLDSYIEELETEQQFECFENITLDEIRKYCDLSEQQEDELIPKIEKIIHLQLKYWANSKEKQIQMISS